MHLAILCALFFCPANGSTPWVSHRSSMVSVSAAWADKAFDSNTIIALNERGAKIIISQHSRRTFPLPLDKALY
ncbi:MULTISPECIES: hypothetical protein [unclassified Mesorhizobium]|uniref:hypothetical protein n=1 Tax=unclassified Mesorhizobium TaxID=325217 RepID=UPI000F75F9CD|nr:MULTISPECIES: hypothetical protein [unclassified Mesorhizobium]TGQ62593.1 hypothetical protein EN848_32880 [bacterium M00.F.Ca.ET.205.01.1.1]TGS90962.1 hypothetical protein EN820_53550 [bacterium M00.F.Ca.ET.177.01.1.1]TGT51879.1 hypothetical protein EN813_050115 [Mesorhizobium sp. M00.F.Ca.ET.170.01.1.1]TGU45245.1 hypothetical protein EN795_34100 [bacterium M00.F.Ca.ET.152.01.1.1]TGV30289.1 hypothetical protein EN829_037420 [Mesorhizobium sp. M00.F.Ca.ET.186.01.1.1]TGZ38623.1 hypothetical